MNFGRLVCSLLQEQPVNDGRTDEVKTMLITTYRHHEPGESRERLEPRIYASPSPWSVVHADRSAQLYCPLHRASEMSSLGDKRTGGRM